MNIRKTEQELIGSRRDVLVRALSLGWLAGGAGWSPAALASLFGKLPGKLPAGRSIFEMKGEVLVNGPRATQNTVITPSDKVTTGAGSRRPPSEWRRRDGLRNPPGHVRWGT